MSRKRGTTRQKINSRRNRNAKKERLIRLGRRVSIVFAVLCAVAWLGAWVWFSGLFHDSVSAAQSTFYNKTASIGFAITDILVEGREHTDPDVLRALINVERGDSIFLVNPSETKKLIERISWVKEAHVERRFPDKVYIGLIERKPMALWQNKGKIRVIDYEGVTLTDRNIKPFADLMIVVGESAPSKVPELFMFLQAEKALLGRVEAASLVGERRWDLKLKTGITIRLPEDNIGQALSRLMDVHKKESILDKDLMAVDLRKVDRVIVRTKPGTVQEYVSGSNKGNEI
jgi:cell division protein FtsQ